MLEGFANAVLDAAAGGFPPSRDAALRDGFPGDAGEIVDSSRMECVVGIGHPRHFPFAGSDVGARHVFSGADVFLADQFGGEAPGDLFDLLGRIFLGIEANAAFGAAERNVDDRALVGHQRGQRHDFVGVDHFAVADTALYRFWMVAVFGAPAFEDFVVIAAEPDRKLEVVHVVAGFDLAEKRRMNLQILCGAVELLRNDAVEVEIFLTV